MNRNVVLSLVFAVSLLVAGPAFASASDSGCAHSGGIANGCTVNEGDTNNDNSTTNEGGTGGNANAFAAASGFGGAGGDGGNATAFGGFATGGDGGDAVQGQQQGQIGINANDTRDYNTNVVGGAKVDDSGNSNVEVGNGFGNLSPSASARNEQDQDQDQGQAQGQDQGQAQSSKQGQFGYVKVDSHDIHEAQERNPVSSAAPVSASACASGVSAQGVDLGAAVAQVNVYCNLALTAEVARANGNTEAANRMVELMAELAERDARGIGGFRSFVRGLPVLGGVLSFIF